jgi:hypothetical protein
MEKKARAIWVAAAQNAGGQMSSQARRLRWVRSGGGVRHETAGDGSYHREPGRQAKVYYTYFTWLTCRTRLLFATLCVAPSGLCGFISDTRRFFIVERQMRAGRNSRGEWRIVHPGSHRREGEIFRPSCVSRPTVCRCQRSRSWVQSPGESRGGPPSVRSHTIQRPTRDWPR